MSLLDILTMEPHPIDGRLVKFVQPLGADEPESPEDRAARLEAKRLAEQRRRAAKREQINAARNQRRALLRKGYA
jgi:hypothetical protein